MNKNIYIAGQITGSENFKKIFKAAEIDLKKRGWIPMNPATLNGGFEHTEYMHICYSMIDVCDTVYLLLGWQKSKGAVMEHEYAIKNHKDIIREEEKTDVCKFCNKESSMGNDSLYNNGFKNIFIYRDRLCLLDDENPMAVRIKINYCPVCGGKI